MSFWGFFWRLCLGAMLVGALASQGSARDLYALTGACLPDRLVKLRHQIQRGTVSCGAAQSGEPASIRFEAGPKQGKVGKAALILPFKPAGPGSQITVDAELFVPTGTPLNSLVLIDAECKRCGMRGNPGLRVYMRRAGLRVDRKKIGEKHAWAVQSPPVVTHDQWFSVRWVLDLDVDTSGGASELSLNGDAFLVNAGRTLPIGGSSAHVDRIQIGLTANSNSGPAVLYARNIVVSRGG